MKKFGEFICKNKVLILIISAILLILSFIGMNLTKINYDILVYLPDDVETIKGQNLLTNDFNMGAYSITIIENMSAKDILSLEEKISQVDGVNKVASIYDVVGTTIPIESLPSEVTDKLHQDNTDILFITFDGSTSSEKTLDAVTEIREITDENVRLGGMSSMVLDTRNLSNSEILIYIIIAVCLCLIVLELSLDSYVVPIILLGNIGCAILFNLGTNIFLGEISYITKALVAVLQLGVTTDFSIFLYHSYEFKKSEYNDKEKAMKEAISETFTSVTGSSLTTIAGFLCLCMMELTLGRDLGIVMAKGVLIGVICVLTLFPSLLLAFDNIITKTKHKVIIPKFNKLNHFIVKHNKVFLVLFIILLIPLYLANRSVDVYYKIDESLPKSLESIKANEELKEKFNIVSPEIILLDKNLKTDEVLRLKEDLESVDGVDFVLTFASLKEMGITTDFLTDDLINMFENDEYQMILLNSVYDIATDELNEQIDVINKLVKSYDENSIVAGEGPLMKDLIEISDNDFKNVNYASIICIFIILFFVLRSLSLPFLLIIAIEFAIFFNMGISYFTGTVLPFVAPIVIGTIQLGATIDYAILTTSTYIKKRRSGLDKNIAMEETLNYCGTSILVSGMCFFAATFGVGIYSDLQMVASLCNLISRGAIISMCVVICVLPSILLLFDKLVLKTTLSDKKEGKKMNKKLVTSLIISSVLLASMPLNTKALEKNETVYTKLENTGEIKKIIVNEELINDKSLDTLNDYSELENILNINSSKTFTKNGRSITWNADGTNIFYQGETDKKLPVNVSITYKLDGKTSSVKDMLGKSGEVEITLKYTNTDKHTVKVNGKNETLYTPFVVVASTIIDNKYNSNITINNGKIINSGNKTIIVGLSTPGLYESINLSELKDMDVVTIKYDTTKFELASIYSIVTPKVIDSSDLNIFDKLDSLYASTESLKTNMDKIETGAKELQNGSNTLKESLEATIKGMQSSGSDEVLTKEEINNIKTQAVASAQAKLTKEYKESIADATWESVKNSLNAEDEEVVKLVTEAVTEAVTEYLKDNNDYVACQTGKAIMAQGGSMSDEQKNSCNIISTTLPIVEKSATTAAALTAKSVSSYVAEKISKQVSVAVLEQTVTETAGSIAEGVAPLVASGVKNAALNSISTKLDALYAGISAIDNGINELTTGISTYNQEGITKIYNIVNGSVKTTSLKLEALSELADDYNSFAGIDSKTTGTTKFVLVVDAEKATKSETKQTTTQTKLSLWERIKNLFK